MDKRSEQIFDEIRQMELDAIEDVKQTADKINHQRNRELSNILAVDYIGGYGTLVVYSVMGVA